MDLKLTEDQQALEKSCAEFAQNEIKPYLEELEQENHFRKSLFVRMAKMGFFDLIINHDTLSYVLAVKEISKVDAGVGVAMSVSNMGAEALDLYGTIDQKKRFLRKIGQGEWVPLAFALTERHAGSDAKNIHLHAASDSSNSNNYILTGEKQFVTNGDIAGLVIVFAKSDHGITAFLAETSTGIKVYKIERKLGLLTVNLCDLRFEHCKIPKQHILGVPGEGLQIALASLDSGRIGIAAQALGIAEAAYETALTYAKERIQFGKPLIDNQAIAFKLADMHTRIEAGRLLLYKAAWLKDQKRNYTLEAAQAKLFCSEMCNFVADEALQIHGGYGYVKGYSLAEKYFRDARATTLYEGTSEIQRIIISRHL